MPYLDQDYLFTGDPSPTPAGTWVPETNRQDWQVRRFLSVRGAWTNERGPTLQEMDQFDRLPENVQQAHYRALARDMASAQRDGRSKHRGGPKVLRLQPLRADLRGWTRNRHARLTYSPTRSVQLSTEVLKTTSVSGMTVSVTNLIVNTLAPRRRACDSETSARRHRRKGR
jgi:hypothetical protein